MSILESLELMKVSVKKKEKNFGCFNIEPLSPGYGITIANSLRRTILSSIEGAAITTVKINDATHEFSTIKAVKEDVVQIILNLKGLRLKKYTPEKTVLKLRVQGPKVATAKDFMKNPEIEVIDPAHHIATLGKGAKLSIEATVESGKGYLPTEERLEETLPIGHIAIDSIFTPIKKIHYGLENVRVGKQTNYDKIIFEITTDGSIDPEDALKEGAVILTEHFNAIGSQLTASSKPKTKKSSGGKNAKSKTKK